MVKLGESKVVEGDPDHAKAVEDTERDCIGPSSIQNERIVNMNTLCQGISPKGLRGKKGKAEGVVTNWKCESNRKGIQRHGEWCGEDSATSCAHCNLK